jgi:hypothetical protein
MTRVAIAVVVLGLLLVVAGIARAGQRRSSANIVVSCPGNSFSFAFRPRHGAVVTSGGRMLAKVSIEGWSLSRACTAVADPQWSGKMAEPQNNIYRQATIHCRIGRPLRIYLSPLTRAAAPRRNILVTAGNPMSPVVGAMLRSRPRSGPRGTFLYRNPAACHS